MTVEGRALDRCAVAAAVAVMASAEKKRRHVGAAQSHVMTGVLWVSSLAPYASAASCEATGLAILAASNAMMSSVPVGFPSLLR